MSSTFANRRGYRWEIISNVVRSRDGNACRRCGETSTSDGRRLPVHHIVHENDVGVCDDPHDPTNLVTVCPGCHREMEGKPIYLQLLDIGTESRSELRLPREAVEGVNERLTYLGETPLGRRGDDPREGDDQEADR